MQHPGRTFFAYTFCFLSFAAFGYYHMQFNTDVSVETVDMASNVEFETAAQCGDDRNYFEQDLKKMPSDFTKTRRDVDSSQPPRQCVTYIMKNFMPLDKVLEFRGTCDSFDKSTNAYLKGPQKFAKAACVTEPYVNSIYNSLVDVSDCFNIPLKELLPKLFNESGLHVNTLGRGGDAGVGQLTMGALKDDVFQEYDNAQNKQTERLTSYEWIVREMGKSTKPSCQRIKANKDAINIPLKVGTRLCSKEQLAEEEKNGVAKGALPCFAAFTYQNRCLFMNGHENPLRNLVAMAVLYKNNQRNLTGVEYIAGEDRLNSQVYVPGTPYGRHFGTKNFVERFRRLGISNPDQEVIRQIILSLGFNIGLSYPISFMDKYLDQRESLNLKLSSQDIDFQNTQTGDWAVFTNLGTFWQGLSGSDTEYRAALKSLEVSSKVKVGYKGLQDEYGKLRNKAQFEIARLPKNLTEDEMNKELQTIMLRYDPPRRAMLDQIYAKAGVLTLPEFFRIAQAKFVSGGSLKYLWALSEKYKELDRVLGRGVCTTPKYLKF
ncbi:hypothetical protein [Bdellovibrio svalbardensis]|uniref:Uncharacterized protein n=1 Tax=Bdellovibrio svalbardensis TaxID=2972972 RepID=A0ABT6DIW9_9BACT|nr:hypothetical protein [Bdellovibrio svalbardensis]MDG0815869.1 hypothetical protein [Bdellovibrio svalbardensis]